MHVPYDAPPEWEVLQPAEPGRPDAIFDNYCTGSATPTPYENARCHYGSSERCPQLLVICDQVANLKGFHFSAEDRGRGDGERHRGAEAAGSVGGHADDSFGG